MPKFPGDTNNSYTTDNIANNTFPAHTDVESSISSKKRVVEFKHSLGNNPRVISDGTCRNNFRLNIKLHDIKDYKVFNLSKAVEIVIIFGQGVVGISRPVRSGKTNLLSDFECFLTNENKDRNEIIAEARAILSVDDKSRTKIYPSLKQGLEYADRLFPENKKGKQAQFIIFKFSFIDLIEPCSEENKSIHEIMKLMQKKIVEDMNDELNIHDFMSTIYYLFEHLEKEEFGIDKQQLDIFKKKLNETIAFDTLPEKIRSLSELLRSIENYCIENMQEENRPCVPRIVILVDEFNQLLKQLKRKTIHNDLRIKNLFDEVKATNEEYYDYKYKLLDAERNILFRKLKLTIQFYEMFMNSVKDNDMIQNVVVMGLESIHHYFESKEVAGCKDLTFDPEFSNCCGITRKEVKHHLGHYLKYFSGIFNDDYDDKSIKACMKRKETICPRKFRGYFTQTQKGFIEKFVKADIKMTEDHVLDLLDIYYNNIRYGFDNNEKTYNIWSVTKVFENLQFKTYWIASLIDIINNLRSAEVILYFMTTLDPTIDFIKQNKITHNIMEMYKEENEQKLLKPTYTDILIRLKYLGVMSITPYIVDNEIVSYYLYPSCLEGKLVLHRALYGSIDKLTIQSQNDLQDRANSYVQCENMSLRLENIIEKLKEEDRNIERPSLFLEKSISERVAIHLTEYLDLHIGLINVRHRKFGNSECKPTDKAIDVCVTVKSIIKRYELDEVSIIEFKMGKWKSNETNNCEFTANEAIASVLARKYHQIKKFDSVKMMTIVGIHALIESDESKLKGNKKQKSIKNLLTKERVMGYEIQAIKIKDKKKLKELLSEFNSVATGSRDERDEKNIILMMACLEKKENESPTEYDECFEILKKGL